MKIDVFNHIIPEKYKKALFKVMASDAYTRRLIEAFPTLTDLDVRFRIIDKYDGLLQVITTGAPPPEDIADPGDTVELARIANDEMAELVLKYPDRFPAAVACLPMNDMDATLKEMDRSITELGFRGVQIHSDINGKPLDSPEFAPLFEKMAAYNLPILLHPEIRTNQVPDYPGEPESYHMIHIIFGWPYRTTVAMTRLAMSGIFEKFPTLKIITHHCGAMVPFFEQRINVGYMSHQSRMGFKHAPVLTKRPLEYFRMFYGDTALYGSLAGLTCGYAFFGAEHMLFATDMPYDPQLGDIYTRETIRAIDGMDIPESEKKKIYEDNAKELMRLPV
jgi:predicted TIM-barrel fold metal-dependent hydrolase